MKVRIAVVVPYLVRLRGSKMALSIANSLSKSNTVDVFVYNLNADIEEIVKEKLGEANLLPLEITHKQNFGIRFAFKYQVFRGVDRSLSKFIQAKHEHSPYDLVLVIANEGRSIGQYIKQRGVKNPPITAIVIMELHDHGFHLYYERGHSWLRIALWPIYSFVHLFERFRFSAFDIILSNSHWSADNFEYLYGLKVRLSIPGLDYEMFTGSKYTDPAKRYVALPTASIDSKLEETAKTLYAEGINLVSYGPKKIDGIPYVGYIAEEKLPDFLAEASCTLFLFDYEALGLIPLESLASGTPVITFPKQGPYSELKGNKHTFFEYTIKGIKDRCQAFIENGKSEEVFEACKNSVYEQSDIYSCERLLDLIQDIRNENK